MNMDVEIKREVARKWLKSNYMQQTEELIQIAMNVKVIVDEVRNQQVNK
jgi:hypothetical protein